MSFQKCVFKIVIILSIYFICLIKFFSCELNVTKEFLSVKPRIVGGYRPSYQHFAKFVVSLRYRKETEKQFGYTHFCAGSIIESNKILTAAHCIYRMGKSISPSKLKVAAKTPTRLIKALNTQEINVKDVIIHSKYKDSTLFNDIALLILENEIELDLDFAAIIPLPTEGYTAGMLCEVIGWGRLYMYGPLANEILQVDLHLHSRQYCRKRYPHISSRKICASNIDDNEKDACAGDSGGPLICGGVIMGIVSYGIGCPSRRAGIYTNVFMYLDWINNNGLRNSKPSLFISVVNLLLSAL